MAESSEFKVVLLGEGSVGKTSIFRRFTQQEFDDKHKTTIQASYSNKKINLPSGQRIDLALWDTAGQERFHSLTPIYYRDANGAVLVYDITDVNSFSRVKNWVKELRKILGNNVCLAIVGNKMDLEKNRTVSMEDAEKYAQEVGATHTSTSAKLNKGINELFLSLSERMIKNREEVHDQPTKPKPKNTILIDEGDSQETRKSDKCC